MGLFDKLFGSAASREKRKNAENVERARKDIREKRAKLQTQENHLVDHNGDLLQLQNRIEMMNIEREALVGAEREQIDRELILLFRQLDNMNEKGSVILRNIQTLQTIISKSEQYIIAREIGVNADEVDLLNSEMQRLQDELAEQDGALRDLERVTLVRPDMWTDMDLEARLAAYHVDHPNQPENVPPVQPQVPVQPQAQVQPQVPVQPQAQGERPLEEA